MTPRERLTAALRRQPVDRLPWTVDLGYYNAAMAAQGRADPRYEGIEGRLRQQEELGADPYFSFASAPYRIEWGAVAVGGRRTPEEIVTTWRLGAEELTGVKRWMPESFCWAVSKHPVENERDLAVLLRIIRAMRIMPAVEKHRAVQEQCGARGLPICPLPRGPIPALIAEWCGLMTTSYLAADAPDLFEELLRAFEASTDALTDALADYRPVVVHFCDNISGECVSSFWDRWMAPLYARRLRVLRQAGVICVIHNDGTVRSALPRIAAAGFDGAEALTPAPVGDATPAELRALAGREDFILWGMVPGAAFAPPWTDAQFRDFTRQTLAAVVGPHILGSADQIPPDGDLRRVATVARLLRESAAQ
jgi:hypothetical protein